MKAYFSNESFSSKETCLFRYFNLFIFFSFYRNASRFPYFCGRECGSLFEEKIERHRERY